MIQITKENGYSEIRILLNLWNDDKIGDMTLITKIQEIVDDVEEIV